MASLNPVWFLKMSQRAQSLCDCADMPAAAAAENESKQEVADEDMVDPPVKVPRSRWLDEEPEEEEPGPVNKVRL